MASEIELPRADITIIDQERCTTRVWSPDDGVCRLPASRYVLRSETDITVLHSIDGPLTIEPGTEYEGSLLTIPDRRSVTIDVLNRDDLPRETITVRPTPEGVATALTHLHASMKTDTPDRSFPVLRDHPPRLEFGDETYVPEPVLMKTADTGIVFDVPPDLSTILVCAPLAYYLQSTVRLTDCSSPRIRTTDDRVSYEFSSSERLSEEVKTMLQHVFFLDCVSRTVGPYSKVLGGPVDVDDIDFDVQSVYRKNPIDRLETYLSISSSDFENRVPAWHLTAYVSPYMSHVRWLPYLLDRMSLIALPQASALEGSELIKRSLDDFFRSGVGSSIAIVKPELNDARMHAWMADGVPIDAFKTTGIAFENRLKYSRKDSDALRIAVVLNDDQMVDEYAEASKIYRERARSHSLDVTVHKLLSCAELATIFESEYDFVHYVGHCEEDGLRCTDGTMTASSLDECNAQTFFLNACGSYHEGMKLIEKGSVAGAITFSPVLDKQAATVGTTFARLLVDGFGFERAISLARRRIMMGKDYAIVGDGTHTLTRRRTTNPVTMLVDRMGTDTFRLTLDTVCARTIGDIYTPNVEGNEEPCLVGDKPTYSVSRSDLLRLLERTRDPVIFEEGFYWPEEFRAQLL